MNRLEITKNMDILRDWVIFLNTWNSVFYRDFYSFSLDFNLASKKWYFWKLFYRLHSKYLFIYDIAPILKRLLKLQGRLFYLS